MIGINAQQANQNKRNDLAIFEESYAIMKQIITDSTSGACSTTVTTGTTMTQSTATIVITGTVSDPTITVGETLVIASTTITLGTTGTNLNSIIADINDAGISGLVASKNSSSQLVLTYTAPAASTWQLIIGAGTANTALGIAAGTTTATNPDSVTYFNVWQGNTSDPCKQEEINEVVQYFQNLGYTISLQKNTTTGKTFQWVINY